MQLWRWSSWQRDLAEREGMGCSHGGVVHQHHSLSNYSPHPSLHLEGIHIKVCSIVPPHTITQLHSTGPSLTTKGVCGGGKEDEQAKPNSY